MMPESCNLRFCSNLSFWEVGVGTWKPLCFSFQRLLEQQKGCSFAVVADFDELTISNGHPKSPIVKCIVYLFSFFFLAS